MKAYADKHRHVKESDIKTGDRVLVKNQQQGKLVPFYDPSPYVVMKRKGSQITARHNTKTITRDVSHFKKIQISQNAYRRNENERSVDEDVYMSEDEEDTDEN